MILSLSLSLLQNAHGVIDAKVSSIDSLQYNLTNEQGRVKELNKQMPSLETRLSLVMNELVTNKKNLEEKTAILLQTRESLKKARAKTTVSRVIFAKITILAVSRMQKYMYMSMNYILVLA